MIMKIFFLSVLILSMFVSGIGQEVRLSVQSGISIPKGDFSKNKIKPENGGFATSGIDFNLTGEKIYENNFIFGANIGFNTFEINKSLLDQSIKTSSVDEIASAYGGFQNINIQMRLGYNWGLMAEKINISVHGDVGLGIFDWAHFVGKDIIGYGFVYSGSSSTSLLITPGLNVSYALTDFLNISLYGDYLFTNYSVDVNYVLSGNDLNISNTTRNRYVYRSLNFGIGLNFIIEDEGE